MTASRLSWHGRVAAILAGILLGVGSAGAAQLLVERNEGVREVLLLERTRHVRTETLRELVSRHDAEGLAAVDIVALRADIEALAWVRRARVNRRWPDRLVVSISEHELVARVGDDRVWTRSGDLLSLESVLDAAFDVEGLELDALPRLDADAAYLAEAWEQFHLLHEALTGSALVPKVLHRDARGSWTVQTGGDSTLRLGKGAPAETIPRLREVVVPALGGRMAHVDYVDLRYGNGFAVGWRETAPGESNGKEAN